MSHACGGREGVDPRLRDCKKGAQGERHPGGDSGTGLRRRLLDAEDGTNGIGMVLFDSQESANAASGPIRAGATDGVTVDDVEVREVVEHA
jgi:hypothetical protein